MRLFLMSAFVCGSTSKLSDVDGDDIVVHSENRVCWLCYRLLDLSFSNSICVT